MVLLSSLNAQTDHDIRANKLRHKKSATPNLIPKQRHLNGILYKMWFCCKIEHSPNRLRFGLNVFFSSLLRKRVPTINVSDHKQRSYWEWKVAKSCLVLNVS